MTATPNFRQYAPLAALAAVLGWAYLPTVEHLVQAWAKPQYSHGFLVPAFAGYLLWHRPRKAAKSRLDVPLGVALVASGVASRLFAAKIGFLWLDAMSLLPTLAGVALLAGGKGALVWAGPSIAFLAFMVPLPYYVETRLGGPLLRVATLGSTYVLQTLGQPAIPEGNTILLNDFRLGIIEACSGLRMLTTFIAFSAAAVVLTERTWAEKAVILLASVPIALTTNVVRITVTGVVCLHYDSQRVIDFFHDLAGWIMMPMGLALLMTLMWFLNKAVVRPPARPAFRAA